MQLDYATQEPAPRRTWDRWLIALILLGLVLRLGWVLHLPTDPATLAVLPDQVEYFELGTNLRNVHELGYIDTRFFQAVRAYRMPGYPFFVALCGADLRITRAVQALLDASTIAAVYLLAICWMSRGGARLAAFFITANPFLIYFSGLILSETLFSAMLIWGMLLIVSQSRWYAWLAGLILLILSIYVRPSAMALPLVLSIVAAFVNRRGRTPYDWKWSPPVGALTVGLTFLALLPWAWRNQRVVDSWIWTTTNSGITFYDGLNPNATGASDQTFVRFMPQLKRMDEVGRSRYLSGLASQFARENPMKVLQLSLTKIARTWSPIPLSSEYGTNPRLVAVAALYMVPLFTLVVIGLWLGDASRSVKVFLLAPAVYFTVMHAVSVGSLRYRIPADLPMAVVAGFALQFALSRRAARSISPALETPALTEPL